jgi:hypothetical protein
MFKARGRINLVSLEQTTAGAPNLEITYFHLYFSKSFYPLHSKQFFLLIQTRFSAYPFDGAISLIRNLKFLLSYIHNTR